MLFASVLPPPFPFKLFVITTGVLRFPLVRFIVAIAAGRAFRFLLEGYLAARYGEHAGDLLARYYPAIGLSLAGLIIAIFIGMNLVKRQKAEVRGQMSDVSKS